LRTSAYVQVGDTHFVIDSGPDFRQQMLRLQPPRLDAILFTHVHKDHTAGLDDVRAFNFQQKEAMPLYGQAEVLAQLEREFYFAFGNNRYPGAPMLSPKIIENKPFEIAEGIQVTPIEALHAKLPVFGYRIGDLVYLTDANFIAEEEKEKMKNAKVLVLNALRKTKHHSHFTLREALRLVRELKPERAYLTHLSHTMGRYKDVEKELPENVQIAYDGLSVKL
jgi:phosphoribosyl 1,2-cyclic phosphate phosphodiesterase